MNNLKVKICYMCRSSHENMDKLLGWTMTFFPIQENRKQRCQSKETKRESIISIFSMSDPESRARKTAIRRVFPYSPNNSDPNCHQRPCLIHVGRSNNVKSRWRRGDQQPRILEICHFRLTSEQIDSICIEKYNRKITRIAICRIRGY